MIKNTKSAEEVKTEVAKLSEEIKVLKERAREHGLAFSSLSEAELVKKEKGETSNSPYIYAQSWTSIASPGNIANYTVHVRNPDPGGYFPVYATIYFGLGNFFDVSLGWAGRDSHWPNFSSDRTNLPANANHIFSFSYAVPTGLPHGTYNGNTVIWRGSWHDVGAAFDRGSFDLKLL